MATSEQEVTARSTGVPGIIEAKLAVMAVVKGVRKDRENKHQGYKFIGHDDATEALQDAFVTYGIAQTVSVIGCVRAGELVTVEVLVRWTSVKDGTHEEVKTFAEATSKAKSGRPDSVEVGAAVSYAVKTAQLKNFMLVGGAVPDPEEAEGREDAPARREEPKNSPKKQVAGVPEEEVTRWASSYERVTDQKSLDELRGKLSHTVKFLTDEQYERLEQADMRAAERVNDEVPT